jgi:hypothetical protein
VIVGCSVWGRFEKCLQENSNFWKQVFVFQRIKHYKFIILSIIHAFEIRFLTLES